MIIRYAAIAIVRDLGQFKCLQEKYLGNRQ